MIPQTSAGLRSWQRLLRKASVNPKRANSNTVSTRQASHREHGERKRLGLLNRTEKSARLKERGHKILFTRDEDPASLERELRASDRSPFRFLQDKIERGEGSIGVVSVCLDVMWREMQKLPRVMRRREYEEKNEHIATEVLRLIWSEEKLWVPLVTYDWHAVAALSYFAVLEGQDHLMLQWTAAKVESTENVWRGNVLCALVHAHTMLEERSADGILATFLHAAEMQEDAKESLRHNNDESPILHCSLYPAYMKVASTLTQPGTHYTSVDLFERYLHFVRTWSYIDAPNCEYQLASYQLYHPRKPDHNPAMALLKKFCQRRRTLFSENMDPKMERVFRRLVFRTALVADYNGRPEDVRWLKEALKDYVDPVTPGHAGSGLQTNEDSISTMELGLRIRKVLQ